MIPLLRSVIPLLLAALATGCVSRHSEPWPAAANPVRMGSVVVDRVTRTVDATGFVNQVHGPIELLACGGVGKTHESIFVLEVSPVDFQAALLAIGAKSGRVMRGIGVEPPEGSKLEMRVAWSGTEMDAAEAFFEGTSREPLKQPGWTFTGSVIADNQFKALAEESFVATYWDPWAIINLGHPTGEDDNALFANTQALPPIGTPVTIRIRLARE